MKKILFSVIGFLAYIPIQAQILFSTTSTGGSARGGTIHKFVPATNNLTILKSFEKPASRPTFTNFIQASNGKLYSMTSEGGHNDEGVIFSYDPLSGIYTKLVDFDEPDGAHPNGSLIQATNGKLYGMTTNGGLNNRGVIFSFDPSSGIYKKLKDFDDATGSRPYGNLIQANDGKLYGMTTFGGANGDGVIFSLDLSSGTYTKLEDFDDTKGSKPYGSLIQANDGKLYGMTSYGGTPQGFSGYGVIFSFDPSSSIYSRLMDFTYSGGYRPNGSLIQASNGKLYGMTTDGGTNNAGVIFSFDPSALAYTNLKDLGENYGNINPKGSLIQASDGKLYGMTSWRGGIFSFDPSNSAYKNLKNFDNYTEEGNPQGSLLQASDGKLYGMTTYGGINDAGIIFSLNPSSLNL